jgi:hypothetical protein
MWRAFLWNWLGMALLTAVLALIRMDQEETDRKLASLRRLCNEWEIG